MTIEGSAIRELRVVPGELAREGVESSRDEGKPRNDLKPNELEAQVLRTGQPCIEVREDEKGAYLYAIRPTKNATNLAVVADEVRKLAEKSASSANEIDAITHTLGKQSDQVTRSIADAMEHIATSRESMMTVNGVLAAASESVVAVGRGLDSIAAATREQERVSADVFSGIERIKQMAQGNSDAAGQTAAAARNMGALAGELQGAVGRFHT